MNCKAVFFDLDDTLCHAAQAWRKAEQDTFDNLMLYSYPGSTELDARRVWESVQQDLFTQLDNHLLMMADLRDIRFQKTLDELDISDLTLADELNKQLSTKRLSYMTLCDGVIDTLTTLRSRYHFGIIINGAADEHPDSQYATAKQLNLFPYIDSFWVSDEIGYRKLETEIFSMRPEPYRLTGARSGICRRLAITRYCRSQSNRHGQRADRYVLRSSDPDSEWRAPGLYYSASL